MEVAADIAFGRGTCCWKPQGCTNTDGCRLLGHPAKRAMRGDPTAPCPMGWVVGDRPQACRLTVGHDGDCLPAR